MSRGILLAVLATGLLVLGSCSSTSPKSSTTGKGFKVLEAVVTQRIFAPPGSPGTTMAGNGSWFLEFEAQDGTATAHYRFQVSRDQYNRYQEGERVRLVLANEELRDIRPMF
jgi:uncharacterized cupredoxin-like copper-binding protein